MKTFNVIVHDFNNNEFVPYNVIPYFVDAYKERIEKHEEQPNSDYWKIPKTFEEFKDFIKSESQYQFWARCEYEIILVDWPCQKKEEKIDVHRQIMMNLGIVTQLVIESIIEEGLIFSIDYESEGC